jgi:hypothetical protein
MIHHISIPARDPLLVGHVLAEITGGRVFRFPGPLPGATIVVSGDEHGTAIEVYPEHAVLEPGTDDDEAVRFVDSPDQAGFSSFHALLTVPLTRAQIERIGSREGWRTKLLNRGGPGRPPLFQVIELWVENRIMLELAPTDLIEPYLAVMQPANLDAMGLGLALWARI